MTETLCNTCCWTTAVHCAFIGRGDKTGLKLRQKVQVIDGNRKLMLYQVVRCPRYREGPLPPLGAVVPAGVRASTGRECVLNVGV
ncbi:MAG: hypothetical protein AB1609_00705 [Bacillota bacterium]